MVECFKHCTVHTVTKMFFVNYSLLKVRMYGGTLYGTKQLSKRRFAIFKEIGLDVGIARSSFE